MTFCGENLTRWEFLGRGIYRGVDLGEKRVLYLDSIFLLNHPKVITKLVKENTTGRFLVGAHHSLSKKVRAKAYLLSEKLKTVTFNPGR